jgi:hypothetical protein
MAVVSEKPQIIPAAAAKDFASTTVVLPGFRAEVDRHFNILITPTD